MGGLYAIYFARGLISGLTKIGRTGSVAARLQSLAATAEPVDLLATMAGPWELEGQLHKRFAALLEPSRGREWFRDDGSIAAFIATLPEAQRGSVTFRPSGKRVVRRSPDVIEAERKARQTAYVVRFVARHGHAYHIRLDGCAQCQRDRQEVARYNAAHSARIAAQHRDPLLYPLAARNPSPSVGSAV